MSARYRVSTLAYPPAYRREHGEEVIDTANELTDGRWSFRQARSLMAGGLRTRARSAANGTARGLWLDGVGVALVLWLLLRATPSLVYGLGATGDVLMLTPSLRTTMALGLLPAIVLTLTTRWPAAVVVTIAGLAAVGIRLSEGPFDPFGYQPVIITASQALAAAGLAWWLAVMGDGRRAMSPVAAAAALVVLVGPPYLADSPDAGIAHGFVLFGLPILGLALIAIDPRPVIAATTVWFFLALTLVPFRMVMEPGFDPPTLIIASLTVVVTGIGALLSRFGIRRLTADVGR